MSSILMIKKKNFKNKKIFELKTTFLFLTSFNNFSFFDFSAI